jgi:hypothetical protein
MMNDLKQIVFMGFSARQRSSFRAKKRAAIDGIVHTYPWPQCGIHERKNMK